MAAPDEQALLEAAVEVEPPLAPGRQRSIGRAVAITALAAGAVAATAAFAARHGGGALGAISGLQSEAEAVPMQEARSRAAARKRLILEGDLGALVTGQLPSSVRPGADRAPDVAAGSLFDHVVESSGLRDELTAEERAAFRARFVSRMVLETKPAPGEGAVTSQRYLQSAQSALEIEKPVVTQALARSLNEANLGFKAKMRSWMVDESQANFHSRLGRAPLPQGMEEKLRATREKEKKAPAGAGEPLPASFDARQKWPQCAEVIGRIHNQGHCGSCWVFGALGPLDSRMCIKTIGSSQPFSGELAQLSRGFGASCATLQGGNGCAGGWEWWVYKYITREDTLGLPSDRCSPYFASGAGIEHFDSSMPAPECPADCSYRFPKSIEESSFKPAFKAFEADGEPYRLVLKPTPDQLDEFRRHLVEGGPLAFGIAANNAFMTYASGIFGSECIEAQANHAVHAIGYGPGYFLGQNSWTDDWGDEGRFKVAPCVPTDFTVPGDIETAHFSALPIPTELGNTTTTTPKPAPDPADIPCELDADGCFSSPRYSQHLNYKASQSCIISYTFGQIDVKDFHTEEMCDYMEVNGERYFGETGPQGVVPLTNIVWSSDFSVEKRGWKICPMTP